MSRHQISYAKVVYLNEKYKKALAKEVTIEQMQFHHGIYLTSCIQRFRNGSKCYHPIKRNGLCKYHSQQFQKKTCSVK